MDLVDDHQLFGVSKSRLDGSRLSNIAQRRQVPCTLILYIGEVERRHCEGRSTYHRRCAVAIFTQGRDMIHVAGNANSR